jgi:small-conductance mechanosensitive channel
VRSTEIETFDRSSVIVPNSELITGVVTNWTHGNSTGRVMVSVGVAYESDPRQVYKLLEEIAKGHPKTLTYPAPRIVFEDFGASSLDFTVRVYIGNITEVLDVTTELRMRIYETFKAHNIEIAFPQLDLHLKR